LIQLAWIKTELLGAGERLDGEGFVDLDGVHFCEFPAGFLAQTTDGMNGAETHRGRIATNGGTGDDACP
jgi:hypothetical protein